MSARFSRHRSPDVRATDFVVRRNDSAASLSAFRKMLFSLSSAEYKDTKRSIFFIVFSHIGYIFSLSDLDMNLLLSFYCFWQVDSYVFLFLSPACVCVCVGPTDTHTVLWTLVK